MKNIEATVCFTLYKCNRIGSCNVKLFLKPGLLWMRRSQRLNKKNLLKNKDEFKSGQPFPPGKGQMKITGMDNRTYLSYSMFGEWHVCKMTNQSAGAHLPFPSAHLLTYHMSHMEWCWRETDRANNMNFVSINQMFSNHECNKSFPTLNIMKVRGSERKIEASSSSELFSCISLL